MVSQNGMRRPVRRERTSVDKIFYDLIINGKGRAYPMSHGFHEKVHELVYGKSKPFSNDEYVFEETEKCIYRIKKCDANYCEIKKFLKRAREAHAKI